MPKSLQRMKGIAVSLVVAVADKTFGHYYQS